MVRSSFQQVLPGLFIGSRVSLYLPSVLAEAGIRKLLAVNGCRNFPPGFQTLSIDARDEEDEPLIVHFERAIKFIKEGEGATFVFCDAGISRSATIVAAFLIKEKGMDRKQAVDTIRKVRSVRPNGGFLRQLNEFAQRQKCELCHLERRSKWMQETRDFVVLLCDQCDFPLVVYRHHSETAPAEVKSAMLAALRQHANEYFQDAKFEIDYRMRTIPSHFHFHARPASRFHL